MIRAIRGNHTQSQWRPNRSGPCSGLSLTWMNQLEADVPLDWNLFGRRVHTGGYFSRTELAGHAATGFNENHFYTINGRLVVEVHQDYRFLRWVGLSSSYFFGDHFTGWSAGFTLQLQY